MKHILSMLSLSILLMACTQSEGHIGRLYGTWALDEMTIDGSEAPDFKPGETMWSFQNDIIFVQRDNGLHDSNNRMGTWVETDNTLELNFMHSDNATPAGTGRYEAPAWLGFEPNAIEKLTYIERKSHSMSLRYTNPDGNVYTYYLRKTY